MVDPSSAEIDPEDAGGATADAAPDDAIDEDEAAEEEAGAEEEPAEEAASDHDDDDDATEVDAEAIAAAAVAVSYAAAAALEHDGSSIADADGALSNNKWSKNGYGAPVEKQSGKFGKDESETVRRAIEEYCNAKQISVSRLCSECDHKAELKGAWMEIAKRLPHRSVQSVYRHGIRQCHPFKRGAWSEQECAALADLVSRLGKKWSTIQAKLNRSADSCRDKHREMSDEFVKGRWKEDETEALKKLIHEHLNSQTGGATSAIVDMKELGKLVEEGNIQIPWSIISKRMAKRSRLSCFKKWQKMTGLFSSPAVAVAATTTTAGGGDSAGAAAAAAAKPLKPAPPPGDEPAAKRVKVEAATTAAAAATDATATAADGDPSTTTTTAAELAAETVEALELPDTDAIIMANGGGGIVGPGLDV